jgi:hypothetical protein
VDIFLEIDEMLASFHPSGRGEREENPTAERGRVRGNNGGVGEHI